MSQSSRSLPAFIASLFFFSGFAALVYQVVWMRQLSLFFGSDVYAAAITLSVFMGGLSLGSWIAEKWADRTPRPLLSYGIIEVGIGVFAFFFPSILDAFLPVLKSVYNSSFDASPLTYQATRFGLAGAALLVPTTLMGVTLPLIVSSFVSRTADLGKFGGFFYAINTLGALVGTLVGAFALIPNLGVKNTTLVAVAINILVGIVVCVVGGKTTVPSRATAPEEEDAAPKPGVWQHTPEAGRVALWAIGISGMAALALEVVWTRILTLSFSGTVYSFAIMLSSFLLGIFWGSRAASKTIDGRRDPVRYFANLELALGFFVALLGLLSAAVPKVFGILIWGLSGATGGNFALASILSQSLLATLLIIVPTLLLGATFPAAVRIATPSAKKSGSGTARVYAANTCGAILGSLLAGFALVPAFGSRNALVVIGLIFTCNGLLLLWQSRGRSVAALKDSVLPLGATAVVGVIVFLLPRQIILNYGQAKSTSPEVIYHGEGISHSVDIVKGDNKETIMMVDGNVEADTSFIQRRHFILKAHLPLLLHEKPREIAVVGLGLGITLSATARNPEVEKIQLIELTPEMPKAHAHPHLEGVTNSILKNPKLNMRIDDGRNFLAMTDRQFDMITADPIHPRISGVGYLYSEDYYRSLKARLRPGGTVCQWMPMYHISRRSFDVAFRSFARVFENGSFWYVRGHGLFVATNEPFKVDYARLRQRAADAAVTKDLASIEINSPAEFLGHMLMGPAEIQKYLASCPDQTVNTDDNADLEYKTPFEFLHPTKDVVAALEPHAGFDPALLTNITDAERAEVMKAWNARRARLLPELDEPLR